MYTDVDEVFEKMKEKAKRDPNLRAQLLATKETEDPLSSFCTICRREGFEIWPMEIVDAGEEMYAAMKRSTNGGGENSPRISWEDDLYTAFLGEI